MKKTITKGLVVLALAMPVCASAQSSPTFEWGQKVGRPITPCNNSSFASAVDAAGNVYTTGRFQDTTDFDPGAGTVTLTPASTFNCAYVNKTDPNGNLIWAKAFTGVGDAFGRAVAVDDTGNVYVTGSFTGTIDFDPGTGVSNRTSAGAEDYFRVTLNPSGNFISATSGGGGGQELGTAIATDHSGNLYISYDLAGSAARNVAIIKGSGGVVAWTYQMSGSGSGYCYGSNKIALDAAGNVYVTGFFRGSINFNPAGSAWRNSTLAGTPPSLSPSNDIYILKITASGVFAWVQTIGGTGALQGQGIVADAAGNTYSVGRFIGTSVDFDPGSGSASLSATNTNGYILKLDADGNFKWVKQVSSGSFCDARSVDIDNLGNFYVSGDFTGTYSLPWASVGPFSGGSATSDGYILKIDTAGTLGWNGTLAVSASTARNTLSSITVTGDGNIYATCSFSGTVDFDPGAGVANFTPGSDMDLGLIKLKQCFLNDAVSLAGTTITATMAGVSYQWIDCAGNTPVGGATTQNFTPAVTGNYAVVITSGSCTDTSVCTMVTIPTAAVTDLNGTNQVSVYPNPATNMVTIANLAAGSRITILDITGKTVYQNTSSGTAMNITTSHLSAGLYVVKITDNSEQTSVKKLVVNR
ncbi:MAG: T9SS type A sorting domain-containing protein [Taibaiella sp.]|nr:T9SS type A sorting domain-containing protein [Taibaiella sp.]